jgi:cupin 2 domain-containing protein
MSNNIFADLASNLPEELSISLIDSASVRIEKIVSHGHSSPAGFWYDQVQHEWVILLAGAARLTIDRTTIELKPGDYINIPAHRKHRVEWTTPDEPTVWLAVHYDAQ